SDMGICTLGERNASQRRRSSRAASDRGKEWTAAVVGIFNTSIFILALEKRHDRRHNDSSPNLKAQNFQPERQEKHRVRTRRLEHSRLGTIDTRARTAQSADGLPHARWRI